jgi:hypothetical protein
VVSRVARLAFAASVKLWAWVVMVYSGILIFLDIAGLGEPIPLQCRNDLRHDYDQALMRPIVHTQLAIVAGVAFGSPCEFVLLQHGLIRE